jgi:hypothetical protein
MDAETEHVLLFAPYLAKNVRVLVERAEKVH